MTEQRGFVHRLHLVIATGFIFHPLVTWGSVVLGLVIACWGWGRFVYPEWFTEGPFIPMMWVYLAGLMGWVSTLYCLVMLFVYSQRRRILTMDLAWQFHHYRDVTPPPHLMDYMKYIADVSQVGGTFQAFLASYPEDGRPTTQVMNNHLKMLLDEQRQNKG